MKKFLSIIFALVIMIPALNVSAARATVPNFERIANGHIEDIEERSNYDDEQFYRYTCEVGTGKTLFNRYISKLKDFTLIDRDNTSYGDIDCYFLYTGPNSRNIKSLTIKGTNKKFNLSISFEPGDEYTGDIIDIWIIGDISIEY